jgi:hypothetical protein
VHHPTRDSLATHRTMVANRGDLARGPSKAFANRLSGIRQGHETRPRRVRPGPLGTATTRIKSSHPRHQGSLLGSFGCLEMAHHGQGQR